MGGNCPTLLYAWACIICQGARGDDSVAGIGFFVRRRTAAKAQSQLECAISADAWHDHMCEPECDKIGGVLCISLWRCLPQSKPSQPGFQSQAGWSLSLLLEPLTFPTAAITWCPLLEVLITTLEA
eukprot:2932425-Amphidinium_carterae.1